MSFQNIPLKTIQANVTNVLGTESMPWYNPLNFPVAPAQPTPSPSQQYYRWRVTMNVETQNQSSYLTRKPGSYNGYDVTIGQWIANATNGQSWQITSVESKTASTVTVIVQDVFRYNTFKDVTQTGNGSPTTGVYIIFALSDDGLPQIDPVPAAGIASSFTQNITSRFSYINLQYNYPLYKVANTFAVNDVIAADSQNKTFVLASDSNKIPVGRITSISDIMPGWFTINPINKVVDFLDSLPGDVADTIYSSITEPGKLTTTDGGAPIYIKLRNQTESTTTSTSNGPTTPGNVLSINGKSVTITGTGSSQNLVTAVNSVTADTGVTGELSLSPTVVKTNTSFITTTYGEAALIAVPTPASASINGVTVSFSSKSGTAGYTDYSTPSEMAADINSAIIPNILASVEGTRLVLTHTSGGAITIVNIQNDANGVPFAGPNSGSGLPLLTAASTDSVVKFTALDSRAIDFLDVTGSTTIDFGLVSVENGIKAAGLYIEGGLRSGTSNNPASITVVGNLDALTAITPLVGDQAYVIDSNDGFGNNIGNWSMRLYDGTKWVVTTTQDSSIASAKSIVYDLDFTSPASITLGSIPSSSRVTLITIQVAVAFTGTPTLNLGYTVNVPDAPISVFNGLMSDSLLDLAVAGTYSATTNIMFGSSTAIGDVSLTAAYTAGSATAGTAKIIISYV